MTEGGDAGVGMTEGGDAGASALERLPGEGTAGSPAERQRPGGFPRSGHDDDPLVVVSRALRRSSHPCCDRVEPDYI